MEGEGTPFGDAADGGDFSLLPSISYPAGSSKATTPGLQDYANSPAPTVASSVDASAYWPVIGHDTSEYNTEVEDGPDDAHREMDIEDELAAAAGVYG